MTDVYAKPDGLFSADVVRMISSFWLVNLFSRGALCIP